MEYTAHQKKLLKEMNERGLTLTEKARQGDKVARHIFSGLGFDTDYLESDMDGPRGYQE